MLRRDLARNCISTNTHGSCRAPLLLMFFIVFTRFGWKIFEEIAIGFCGANVQLALCAGLSMPSFLSHLDVLTRAAGLWELDSDVLLSWSTEPVCPFASSVHVFT